MTRCLPRIMLLAALVVLCQTPAAAQGGTLSKGEVDALWEQLLVEERYVAIQYFYQPPHPNVYPSRSRELWVQEAREGLLWGLLGTGGGWKVSGQPESEARHTPGLLPT